MRAGFPSILKSGGKVLSALGKGRVQIWSSFGDVAVEARLSLAAHDDGRLFF